MTAIAGLLSAGLVPPQGFNDRVPIGSGGGRGRPVKDENGYWYKSKFERFLALNARKARVAA